MVPTINENLIKAYLFRINSDVTVKHFKSLQDIRDFGISTNFKGSIVWNKNGIAITQYHDQSPSNSVIPPC